MSAAGSADIVTAAAPSGCEAPHSHAVSGCEAPHSHEVVDVDAAPILAPIDEEMEVHIDDDPVARYILRHASFVGELNQYIGVMDWMAYGWAKKTRVVVLIADETWDLFEVFAPAEIANISREWPDTLHIIGCNVETVAPHWQAVNHWIYCLPLGGVEPSVTKTSARLSRFSSVSECRRSVMWKYSQLGYCVFPTVTDGNCGPDCISQSAGLLPMGVYACLLISIMLSLLSCYHCYHAVLLAIC